MNLKFFDKNFAGWVWIGWASHLNGHSLSCGVSIDAYVNSKHVLFTIFLLWSVLNPIVLMKAKVRKIVIMTKIYAIVP